VQHEAVGANVRMISLMYRGLVALVLTVLTVLLFGGVQAESSFKLVPGLLYGSAPRVLARELLPAVTITGQRHAAILPLNFDGRLPTDTDGTTRNYESTTVVLRAISGPLGASRILNTNADPDCDEFWGPDKWRHAGIWFTGTLGIYLFFKNVFKASKLASYLLSATVMSIVGLAREISDSNSDKNCFSEQDLLANTMGILAAGVVITIF